MTLSREELAGFVESERIDGRVLIPAGGKVLSF